MAAEPGKRSTGKRETRDIVRLVGLAIVVILLIAFIVGNSSTVKVNFVFFDTRASLIWVIVISAVLGLLVDRLIIALGKRRRARK